MSADPIQKALQKLEKDLILDVSFSRGRPKGGQKIKNYQIICKLPIFRKVYSLYSTENINELLSSKYADYIIKEFHFEAIYNIVEKDLGSTRFKNIVSKALLRQPSVIAEYGDKTDFINDILSAKSNRSDLIAEREESQFWESEGDKFGKSTNFIINPIRSKHIDMLMRFDTSEAVYLYRNTIYKYIKKLFSYFHKMEIIPAGLSKFMECDSYLSPFTSYPTISMNALLFGRPFQRIYDDIYLLDKKDLSVLYLRALMLYKNFGNIIFEFFRYNLGRLCHLELYTKQLIFQWNVSCTNFDAMCSYLSDVYAYEIGSGKYHILYKGAEIELIDLETSRPISENFKKEIYMEETQDNEIIDDVRPPIIDNIFAGLEIDDWDPYSNLISSFWLRDLNNCPTTISMDQVISDIKSEFTKLGVDIDEYLNSTLGYKR
jgi:hypothetical protein